jgi:hypothetical protein
MPSFTKRIQVSPGEFLSFNFNRIYTVEGLNFFISFIDNKHESFHFKMKEEGHSWKIIERKNIPSFILMMEDEFSKAIREHLGRDDGQ